ncbi:MAG: radical SAM protein [Candidatus Aminicenantes bacterium]|nr:radical SAM protein [Candidatus Aminicenantes bacterium]NIQ67361.1 radical SAM protein [Candidatus Aminicenantes bacterium]NIT23387.1 radical SAM protein [Candidatus Aminicenantes bacterium]
MYQKFLRGSRGQFFKKRPLVAEGNNKGNNKMGLKTSLSPRLIKNRIRLLKSYLKRETVSRGFPVEIAIEITNHCNANCIMCPRQKMEREKGFMDFDLFKKIVDEAREYTEFVFLHLAGEPLLHPKLMEMIDYCGKIGLKSGFSTNAISLDEAKSKQLLQLPLDLLVLSFDGVTKETYETIRKKANFESTYQNINRFLVLKSKSKKSPYTMIQLIYQEENFKEAKDFYLKWKKSAVDVVRVKPYLNYPGLDEYLGKRTRRTGEKIKPCMLLWRQLAIYWDGTVVACCMDFLSKMVLGNAADASIAEIWNGDPMQKLREIHGSGKIAELKHCMECSIPQVGLVGLVGMLFLDDFVIKKLLPRIEQLTILKNIKRVSYFD